MMQEDRLIGWTNQFGEFHQENEMPLLRGYRSRLGYIDEDINHQWREYLEEKIYQSFQEAVSSSSDSNANIQPRASTDWFGNLRYEWSPWRDINPVEKINVELEDVDPDEFEKVLNGD